MSYLSAEAINDAKIHARACYPQESCGLVVAGKYVACNNIADDPLQDFEIDPRVFVQFAAEGIDAVLHSHPNGPYYPSDNDMFHQIQSTLTWGIIALDAEREADPVLWGGKLPTPDIIGRQFMHGVTDCYSLLRDMFRVGAAGLEAQEIRDWPFQPVTLPDFARKDGWWIDDYDFYETEPPKLGFVEVKQHEVKPGDVFLMKLKSSKFNHAGMLIGGGLIVHHLPSRLSRREPAGLWGRQADRWIRYQGPVDA